MINYLRTRSSAYQPYVPRARPQYAPLARRATRGGQNVVVGFATPATIFHRMDEIDASAKATDAAIKVNLAESDYTRSWVAWFADWNKFTANERSLANLLSPIAWVARSDSLEKELEARDAQLNEFRAQYPSQPTKTGKAPPPLVGPSAPPRPGPGDDKKEGFPFQTVAIVVGVAAVAAVAIVYAPEIKAAFRFGKSK
jgi:hypothetical protein